MMLRLRVGVAVAGVLALVAVLAYTVDESYSTRLMEILSDTKVDGDLEITGQITGDVGIGTVPYQKLDVNGAIRLRKMDNPPGHYADDPMIWAEDENEYVRLYARDETACTTLLSSHMDPGDVAAGASTSFDDLEVELPFSFSHKNNLLGKGAVVDMAAVVAKVEELAGENFTYVYDLPPDQIADAAEWGRKRREQLELEAKQEALLQSPEEEIPIAEAWEEAEIVEASPTIQSATRFRYDLEAEQVVAYEVPVEVAEPVGTGRFERRLKDNVRFDEETGKFYRQRTLEEIDVGTIPEPELPRWIRDRLPGQ